MKRHAILLGSLAVFAAAALVTFACWNTAKPKPFDESDLIPERVCLPAEDNAFATLSRVSNEIYWTEELAESLDAVSEGRSWDNSLAKEILGKNDVSLAWFDESFKRQFAFPADRLGVDEENVYLLSLKTIARLECLRIAQLFQGGKQKEACALALKVAEFGHRLENSGGAEMHYLVGQSIKSLSLRQLRLMAAQGSLPEEELVYVMHALNKLGANEAGLTNSLKAEYQRQCSVLDNLTANALETIGLTNSAAERMAASNEVRRVFSADRTRRQLARTTRALMGSLSAPFCGAKWPGYSQARTIGRAWLEWGISGRHNASGDILRYMDVETLKRLFKRKCAENVEVRATQLLLALKVFATRHHELPSKLAELTPEFFPDVPLDDFDGKPMRYLPELKLIYSVGPDLKDSRGAKTGGSDDLPFEIRF